MSVDGAGWQLGESEAFHEDAPHPGKHVAFEEINRLRRHPRERLSGGFDQPESLAQLELRILLEGPARHIKHELAARVERRIEIVNGPSQPCPTVVTKEPSVVFQDPEAFLSEVKEK